MNKLIEVKNNDEEYISNIEISSEGIGIDRVVAIYITNAGLLSIDELCDGHFSCELGKSDALVLANTLLDMVNSMEDTTLNLPRYYDIWCEPCKEVKTPTLLGGAYGLTFKEATLNFFKKRNAEEFNYTDLTFCGCKLSSKKEGD